MINLDVGSFEYKNATIDSATVRLKKVKEDNPPYLIHSTSFKGNGVYRLTYIMNTSSFVE